HRFRDRLDGDHEGNPVLGEMGFLFQGVNIDRFASDDLSHPSDNSALVLNRQSQIPRYRAGMSAELQFPSIQEAGDILCAQLAGGEVAGDFNEVRYHRRSSGVAPRSTAIEHLGPDLVPGEEHGVVHAFDFRQHRTAADQPGSHRELQPRLGVLRRPHQTDRAVEPVGGMDINGPDVTDAVGGDFGNAQSPFKGHSSQDAELVARVLSIDVECGVRLGEARLLSFCQRFIKFDAPAFHLCEDVVGGAVQNAVHGTQTIARRGFMDNTQNGNTPSDTGFEPDGEVASGRQREEFVAVFGQQILVGGDHRLTLLESRAYELARLAGSPHRLYNYVDVGILQQQLPLGISVRSFRSLLGRHAGPATNGSHVKAYAAALSDQVGVLRDDIGRGPTDGAEANNACAYLLHRCWNLSVSPFAWRRLSWPGLRIPDGQPAQPRRPARRLPQSRCSIRSRLVPRR